MPSERRGSIELGKIAGIEIALDYSWLIVFGLVLWSLSAGYFPHRYPGYGWAAYWIVGLAATLLFFASVLTHELSHATVGNRLGEDVRRITLFIFGGMAHLSHEPRSAGDEFKIALAGPLMSLMLAAAFWLVHIALPQSWVLWDAVVSYLAFINVALALFNLLPGFPLDGGRLFRAILWWRSGDLRKATARAADWGRGLGYGLMGLGALQVFAGSLVGGMWLIFIGLFVRNAATGSYQTMLVDDMLSHARVRDIMVREPVTIEAELSVAEAVENYFLKLGFGGFPVISDGRAKGVLSLAEVRHCTASERLQRRVREVMHPLDRAVEITPEATIADALRQMADADAGRLLVIEQDRLVGLITRSGIARLVQMRTQLAEPETRA
jgi:Zn-dependent protease/predicted transcriptional regulator